MIKLLIFDSNNTIEDYNSYEDKRHEVIKEVCDIYRINSEVIISHFKTFEQNFGKKPWDYYPIFWKDIIETYNLKIEFHEIYKSYIDLYSENVQIFDDFNYIVEQLHSDFKLAIIANGYDDRLKAFIKKSNLSKYFDCILSSGETPAQKPDSFLFQYVLKRMNCSANESIMIGDKYETDILGANNLGITSVRIKRSNDIAKVPKSLNSIPDFSVESLSELPSLLNDIKKFKYEKEFIEPYTTWRGNGKVKTAILLAGGKGNRMTPLTTTTQKCMLKIIHKPMLEILIEFFKDAGVENIVLVTNHLEHQIRNYFGNGSRYKVKISYCNGNFSSTYEAVKLACSKVKSTNFYYCHGNIIFHPDLLKKLYYQYSNDGENTISIIKNDSPIKHQNFKKMDDNSFTPDYENNGDYMFSGLALYNKETFQNNNNDLNGMTEYVLLKHLNTKFNYVQYFGNYYHLESINDYMNIKNKKINHLLLEK